MYVAFHHATCLAPFSIVAKMVVLSKKDDKKRHLCRIRDNFHGKLPLHFAALFQNDANVIKFLIREYPDALLKEVHGMRGDGPIPHGYADEHRSDDKKNESILNVLYDATEARVKKDWDKLALVCDGERGALARACLPRSSLKYRVNLLLCFKSLGGADGREGGRDEKRAKVEGGRGIEIEGWLALNRDVWSKIISYF